MNYKINDRVFDEKYKWGRVMFVSSTHVVVEWDNSLSYHSAYPIERALRTLSFTEYVTERKGFVSTRPLVVQEDIGQLFAFKDEDDFTRGYRVDVLKSISEVNGGFKYMSDAGISYRYAKKIANVIFEDE